MKVVGAVGLNGSGKDTLIEYLHEHYDIPVWSIGDLVRGMAVERDIRPTRSNLHALSQQAIAQHGADYFAKKLIDRIAKKQANVVGITGIRTPTDVRTFREHFGEDFVLVHVKVGDARTRFERVRERDKARDPQDYEKFLQQEAEEKELFHLEETLAMADITVANDRSRDALYREIERKVVEPVLDDEIDNAERA
jgi:dephospho-CoA kinase